MIWAVVVVAGLAAAASALGTGVALRVARGRAILDHPNSRSSHAAPTPTGAGIAVVAVIVFEWLVIWGLTGAAPDTGLTYPVPLLCLLAAVLAAVSWYDDLRGLSPILRLVVQVAVILIAMSALSAHGRIFQGVLPYGLDVAVTAYIWLWFVNLTNFMDGIDGITGVEVGSIGIGVAILAPLIVAAGLAQSLLVSSSLMLYATVLAAAAIGFLVWNWQPAKIFLGDVGSVPLGFLGGWLLLEAAAPACGRRRSCCRFTTSPMRRSPCCGDWCAAKPSSRRTEATSIRGRHGRSAPTQPSPWRSWRSISRSLRWPLSAPRGPRTPCRRLSPARY